MLRQKREAIFSAFSTVRGTPTGHALDDHHEGSPAKDEPER